MNKQIASILAPGCVNSIVQVGKKIHVAATVWTNKATNRSAEASFDKMSNHLGHRHKKPEKELTAVGSDLDRKAALLMAKSEVCAFLYSLLTFSADHYSIPARVLYSKQNCPSAGNVHFVQWVSNATE